MEQVNVFLSKFIHIYATDGPISFAKVRHFFLS